jgi:hypothetical protein
MHQSMLLEKPVEIMHQGMHWSMLHDMLHDMLDTRGT